MFQRVCETLVSMVPNTVTPLSPELDCEGIVPEQADRAASITATAEMEIQWRINILLSCGPW